MVKPNVANVVIRVRFSLAAPCVSSTSGDCSRLLTCRSWVRFPGGTLSTSRKELGYLYIGKTTPNPFICSYLCWRSIMVMQYLGKVKSVSSILTVSSMKYLLLIALLLSACGPRKLNWLEKAEVVAKTTAYTKYGKDVKVWCRYEYDITSVGVVMACVVLHPDERATALFCDTEQCY